MRRTVLGLIGLVAMIPTSIRAEAERPGPPSPSAPPAWINETLVIKMDWSRREMWNPDISYAIVNAENAAELEAIVQRLSHTEEFVASICLGNPLSRQIVGDLVVKLPEGYSANLAKEPVALAPGQWAIRTFSVSGPKRAHSRLPVELILTVPGMGELRETGTVSVLPSALSSSLRDAFVPR